MALTSERRAAFEKLFDLAKQLETAGATSNTEDIEQPLEALQDAARQVGHAFSGSWLGYHSRVYYEGFATPPPGEHFNQEWGFHHSEGPSSGWREYSYADVEAHIQVLAKHPNLDPARAAARRADAVFDGRKAEIISILETDLASQPDAFLSKLKGDLDKLAPVSKLDIAKHRSPNQSMTHDTIALGQGYTTPAHIDADAEVASLRHSFNICKKAADIAKRAAIHLERQEAPAIDTKNLELGPPISPKERPHMPLSAVAHWIASEGGAVSITADEKWWSPAFEKLVAAIVSDSFAVVGRRNGGLPEPMPGTVFVGIPIAYPCSFYSVLWTGDGPYLQCQLFINDDDWEATGGDKLFRSGRHTRAEWTHLQVPSSAVARLWRFRLRRASHEERAATAALAALLREQPSFKKEDARQYCESFGPFGRVKFARIWANARRSAGLPIKASPGAPRKSAR
jgi:hypothetical protein